ncbi:MAG TPA: hypothetical protein VHE61_13930 [Opitutaceae bacterium]|nr:hypothetical protein [Opitutaceae bacterium]
MARTIPPETLDIIERVLMRNPSGMTQEEIAHSFDPAPDLRSVDRWIKRLMELRRVGVFRSNGQRIYIATTMLGGGPAAGSPATTPRT